MDLSRDMNQQATYWPPTSPDEFGQFSFSEGSAELIRCRWQDDAVLFRDAQGREATSSSIVYPEKQLALRGYLALGDFSSTPDPRDLSEAFEIRQVGRTVSLDGDEALNKVYL